MFDDGEVGIAFGGECDQSHQATLVWRVAIASGAATCIQQAIHGVGIGGDDGVGRVGTDVAFFGIDKWAFDVDPPNYLLN